MDRASTGNQVIKRSYRKETIHSKAVKIYFRILLFYTKRNRRNAAINNGRTRLHVQMDDLQKHYDYTQIFYVFV